MEVFSFIFQCLIFIIGMFLLFMFKNYYPKYFDEKGKNLATKEDIGTITRIVESVKFENTTQLEKIKTELGLASKSQMVVYDDERKAIINFVGTITEFYESNINIPNEDATPEGFSYMKERIRTLDMEYGKTLVAESTLKLFCDCKEILEATQPISLALANIQGKTQVFRFKALGNQRMTLILDDIYTKTPTPESFEKFKESVSEGVKIHEEFHEMRQKFHGDYITKYITLLSVCKEYLKTKKVVS